MVLDCTCSTTFHGATIIYPFHSFLVNRDDPSVNLLLHGHISVQAFNTVGCEHHPLVEASTGADRWLAIGRRLVLSLGITHFF